MNIFKSYTYTWWQIGILKLALLTIGTILGAYFADWVLENISSVAMVAVVASVYVVLISFKQLG